MAGRGPKPKDPSTRVRRNVDPIPETVVSVDMVLRGPDLPRDVLPKGEQWHSLTKAWWQMWRLSAQAKTFADTDWAFLLDTALMHHAMWHNSRWEFASELRLRGAKVGATADDRARLRLQIVDPEPPAEAAKPSRYGHLRSVKEA